MQFATLAFSLSLGGWQLSRGHVDGRSHLPVVFLREAA